MQQLSQELLAKSSSSDTRAAPGFLLNVGLLAAFHYPPQQAHLSHVRLRKFHGGRHYASCLVIEGNS